MKNIFSIIYISAFLLGFTGCYTNIIDEYGNTSDDSYILDSFEGLDITGTIILNEGTTPSKDMTIETICETTTSNNNSFTIKSLSCKHPQLVIVRNNLGNIILMARDCYTQGKNVKIDAQSTAIALITLHPLFAPITIKNYPDLVNLILRSEYYPKLYEEVQNSIQKGQDIFDTNNNIPLNMAMQNVLRDLCSEDNFYTQYLRSVSLGNNGLIDYYPFAISTNGNNIIIQNTPFTPSYEYAVCTEKDNEPWKEGLISSKSDYGIMDILSATRQDIKLGSPTNIELYPDGKYCFFFSRMTYDAENDFHQHTITNVLSMLGFPIGNIQKDSKLWKLYLENGIIDDIREIGYDKYRFWNAVSLIYNNSINYFESKIELIRNGTMSLNILEKMRSTYYSSTENMDELLKLSWAFNAPDNIEFCLNSYNGVISSSINIELIKDSGDKQEGFSGQKLLHPLTVIAVSATDTDMTFYTNVKFEVLSGGGSVSENVVTINSFREASTYWTLGDKKVGEIQQVKVVAIDIVTGEEISEPVYFTAKIK